MPQLTIRIDVLFVRKFIYHPELLREMFIFILFFGFFDFFGTCYKLPTINLTKAVSTDGPFGLPAACPIFNIEMSCC